MSKNEPKATPGIPTCPRGFKASVVEEWNYICKELADMGLLAKADRAVIIGYCEAYAEFNEVAQKVAEEGTTLLSLKTMSNYTNPNVFVKNAAADRMVKYAQQLGLTPSARSRINVKDTPEQKDDLESFASKRQA